MFRICGRLTPTAVRDPNSVVLISIPKREVLRSSTKTIDEAMPVLHKCGISARGKILITFAEWDDDPREIYEIEPIRKWTRKVFQKYPYIFYFLSPFANGKNSFVVCLADIEVRYRGRKFTVSELEASGISPFEAPKAQILVGFSKKDQDLILTSTNRYAQRVGDREMTFKEIAGISLRNS